MTDDDHGLTPERLTAALAAEGHAATVTALDVEPVGTGQMGRSYRLRPTYAGDPGGLPTSFVAKVPGGNPAIRATVAGAYRTEVEFYRHHAARLAVRVPRCWHAWATDDATDFLLLMDDLAPAAQGDQIAGCDVAEARRAVENLAGLHGPRWCDPTLADDGMAAADPEQVGLIGAMLPPMTEMFVARMGDRLPAADAEVLRAVGPVVADWLLARPERFAPVHGDYRLDNLMFHPDGPVTALDWQTVALGLPGRDLAYFCATSLRTDDRRAHEHEVVAAYHRALLAHGVPGHPLEECLDDYRFGLLQAPLIIVMGCGMSSPTDRGDAMFLAMTERACAALRDHDPFALL